MSETNKAVVRRIVEEVWNGKEHDRMDEFYAADFVNVDPSSPDVKNLEQFKQWVAAMNVGFPDEQVTIEDMVAEDDKVAKQWSAEATHTGDFMGIPPTNKKTKMSGITIYRIVDGKVKECVWSYDTYGLWSSWASFPVNNKKISSRSVAGDIAIDDLFLQSCHRIAESVDIGAIK